MMIIIVITTSPPLLPRPPLARRVPASASINPFPSSLAVAEMTELRDAPQRLMIPMIDGSHLPVSALSKSLSAHASQRAARGAKRGCRRVAWDKVSAAALLPAALVSAM
jgi:hypothetical protein